MNRRGFLGGVLSTGLASVVLPRSRRAGPGRRDPDRHERRVPGRRGRPRQRALPGRAGLLQRDQRAGRPLRAADHGGRARRRLQPGPVHPQHDPAPGPRQGVPALELRGHADPHARAARDQAVRGSGRGPGGQLHRRPAPARGPLRRSGLQRPGLLPAGDGGAGGALLAGGGAALRRVLPDRRLRAQRHRRGRAGPRRAQRQDRGGGHLRPQRQVRGGHDDRGQGPPRGGQRGRALHRGLPGLRRLRALRARRGLDRADLQRLVRGIGRHARPARQARSREGP